MTQPKTEQDKPTCKRSTSDARSLMDIALAYMRSCSEEAAGSGMKLRLSCDSRLPWRVNGDGKKIEEAIRLLVGIASSEEASDETELLLERAEAEDGKVGIRISSNPVVSLSDRQRIAAKANLITTGDDADDEWARCCKLAKTMGGKAERYASSSLGSIAILECYFDSAPARSSSGETRAAKDYPSYAGKHVLLVDDNPINRKVASRVLQRFKCAVTTASSGQEALEFAGKQAFDLILMDLQMPALDGYETTAQLREQTSGEGKHTIIALTANASKAAREHCLKNGFDDFMTKPIKASALAEAFEKWIEGNPEQAHLAKPKRLVKG